MSTREKALNGIRDLLVYLGEDVNREGLIDTPERFLTSWEQYWGKGYLSDFKDHIKTFETENREGLILVKNIPLYSYCEHHIAPIVGKVHIGYLSSGRVLGLSKFKRIVDVFARRLQIQERLNVQIADALQGILSPLGLAVIIEAEHLCMTSRGIQTQDSITKTSIMYGRFRDEVALKNEFLTLLKDN